MVWIPLLGLLLFADARTLFERGVAQQKAGDLKSAEQSFASASREDPDNFAILGNLGVVRAQLGDFAGALKVYRRALQLNPEAHRLHLNIGIAHFKMSQFTLAATELEMFLLKVPDEPQAQELLALAFYQTGKHVESQGLLQKLIASQGEKLSYLYALGQAQIKAGQIEDGEGTFQRMFSLYPDRAETQLLQAQSLMASNQYELAAKVLLEAEKANASTPGLSLWKGIALEGLGRQDEALAAYQAEIARTGDLLAYYAAGILESRSGDAAKAAALLQKALPIDSERYNVSYYLGRLYTKLNRHQDALAFAKRSMERNPDAASEHYTLMTIYRKLGRLEEARKEAETIRQLQESSLKKDRETVRKLDARPLP